MSSEIFVVTQEQSGTRLDSLITVLCPQISRSAAQKMIAAGQVTINDNPADKKDKAAAGSQICVTTDLHQQFCLTPWECPLEIVYQDDDLAVINKPKGMVVHPGAGLETNTLANALLYTFGSNLSTLGGELRPGIVHRLDKDTSGLLIVAKNDTAHVHLAAQIKEHTFERHYQAVCIGNVKEDAFVMENYLGRNPRDRKKMAVVGHDGRYAKTQGQVLQRYGEYTHLSLQLFTGRTHQIRVQMAKIGHPVAGDTVYGPNKAPKQLHGQCLHAKSIGFVHPTTGQLLHFDSQLPPYFTAFLSLLEKLYATN